MKKCVALLLFCCILFVAAGCSSDPTAERLEESEKDLKKSYENLGSAVGGVFAQWGAWSEAVENAGKGDTDADPEQDALKDAFVALAKEQDFLIEDVSNSGMYVVELDLESTGQTDKDAISFDALYRILNFYGGILELGEEWGDFPCTMVSININVDENTIGSMIIFTSAHTGLIGTSMPVITDPDYAECFEANYNEYLSGTDYQNTLSE